MVRGSISHCRTSAWLIALSSSPAPIIAAPAIIALLLLRDARMRSGLYHQRVCSEILDPKNRELAATTQINDIVISNEMISMVLAQITFEPRAHALFEDLVRSEGSGIQYEFDAGWRVVGFEFVQVPAGRYDAVVLERRWSQRTGGELNAVVRYWIDTDAGIPVRRTVETVRGTTLMRPWQAIDAKVPPPQNSIVFLGSSTIDRWNLARSFPGLPVVNRGLDGSRIADSTYLWKRTVANYRPRAVVLYAGDNDLAEGEMTPEAASADFRTFVAEVHAAAPHAGPGPTRGRAGATPWPSSRGSRS